jgi:gamma-glutamyltranspeptidase/glutathione hydrolase
MAFGTRASRRLCCGTLLLFLTGCSMFGSSAPMLPSGGLVVGDEPRAVEVGAAILAHGGNAADAAAATYFMLSVTYPVAAGLGGGGICIVHDSAHAKTETINFLAREAGRGGEYAVPGNASGFSLLQSAYGRLPWQRVVSPAEGAAATGFAMSQALAARLATSEDVIRLDAGLAAEFLDESGHLKTAGSLLASPSLSQTLAQIRILGPDGFYRGPVASGIVAYSDAEGGGITVAGLSAYKPQVGAPTAAHIGDQIVYLPPSNIGAGKFAGGLLSRLVDAQGQIIGKGNLSAAVASATKASMDAYGIASLPRDLGATGFAIEDSDGLAVSCAVTMNGPFGSGHTAKGTGVALASAPDKGETGLAAAFLTPAIATAGDRISLAGAGAGGPNGTAGIALVLLKLAGGENMTSPGAIRSTGIAPFDTVNIIVCQSGTCATVPDPGANGLGASGGS